MVGYYLGPSYNINLIASLYFTADAQRKNAKALERANLSLLLRRRDHVDPSQLLSLVETSYLQYIRLTPLS